MRPVRVMNVPLDTLFESPALCILRSEICALITIGRVWNTQGDKECPDGALYCGLNICRDMCSLDFYFGYL